MQRRIARFGLPIYALPITRSCTQKCPHHLLLLKIILACCSRNTANTDEDSKEHEMRYLHHDGKDYLSSNIKTIFILWPDELTIRNRMNPGLTQKFWLTGRIKGRTSLFQCLNFGWLNDSKLNRTAMSYSMYINMTVKRRPVKSRIAWIVFAGNTYTLLDQFSNLFNVSQSCSFKKWLLTFILVDGETML